MGDRGNIAIIQSGDRSEQVWFYGHWSGSDMPEILQRAIREGKGRWDDPSYFARIVFCRLVDGGDSLLETTGYGISTTMQDNEHPIMVADCARQIVYAIEESKLDGLRIPEDYEPKVFWTFEAYGALTILPGEVQEESV